MNNKEHNGTLVSTAKLLLIAIIKLIGIVFMFCARLLALALTGLSDFIDKRIKNGKDH